MQSCLVRLPSGRTRVIDASRGILDQLEELEGLPRHAVYLVGRGNNSIVDVRLRLLGGGGECTAWDATWPSPSTVLLARALLTLVCHSEAPTSYARCSEKPTFLAGR